MGGCVSLVAFLVLVVGGLCRVVVALDIGLGTTAVHRVFTSDPSLCTVPLPPPASDVVRCAPNTTATLEDAKALAWKFAPVLKFHPLERYHLQSMNTWFDEASVYLTDYRQFPNSTYNFIVANQTNRDLLGPRTFATLLNGTSSTDAQREQVLFGAPFVDGKSTADMFYTVTDYSDSLWMYNFNLYYSWNGCSNQNVALSFNGTTDVQGYLMCPAGVHEADLERMSMLVCKSDQKIKQIAYSQHAWNEVRDCQVEGQCLFDEETGNPISYVALEGHGNYPESPGNGFHVYTYFGSSLEGFPLDNVGGVYIGDRTGDDPERTFLPTPENVKYIPPLWEIQNPNSGINQSEWRWAEFPGNWGAPLVQAPLKLWCLDISLNRYVECDRNSTTINAVYTIVNTLEISDVIQDQEEVGSFAIQSVGNLTRVPYPDITGPLFRGFSYEYVAGQPAPILTQELYNMTCPGDVEDLKSIPTPGQLDASSDTIISYLIGIVVGTIIFSIILIILLALPVLLDKTGNVQKYVATKYKKYKGKVTKPAPEGQATDDAEVEMDMESADETEDSDLRIDSQSSSKSEYIVSVETVLSPGQRTRLIVWGAFASALFIAGITLTFIGIESMFSNSILAVARDRLGAESLVNTLSWLVAGLCILIIVTDILMFLVIFMFQGRRISVGNGRTIWNPLGGRAWFMNKALTILSIIVGMIAMIVAICAVLFALALVVTLAQLVARVGCNEIFSIQAFGQSAQSICLTIPELGINDVCGWEALQTCGEVTDMTVRNLLIGSMMLLWCHIVWMVIMLAVLETYRTHELKLRRQASELGLKKPKVGLTDRSIVLDP